MIALLLGIANVSVMALAFTHRVRLAAILSMVLQIPWCIWDTVNHYYGFYLIAVATMVIGIYTLRKERNATAHV